MLNSDTPSTKILSLRPLKGGDTMRIHLRRRPRNVSQFTNPTVDGGSTVKRLPLKDANFSKTPAVGTRKKLGDISLNTPRVITSTKSLQVSLRHSHQQTKPSVQLPEPETMPTAVYHEEVSFDLPRTFLSGFGTQSLTSRRQRFHCRASIRF